MKKIWAFLNGNKTIISGLLWGFLQLKLVEQHVSPDILEVARWSAGALAALSGAHHIQKGYFSPRVGNPGQIIPSKNKFVQK